MQLSDSSGRSRVHAERAGCEKVMRMSAFLATYLIAGLCTWLDADGTVLTAAPRDGSSAHCHTKISEHLEGS